MRIILTIGAGLGTAQSLQAAGTPVMLTSVSDIDEQLLRQTTNADAALSDVPGTELLEELAISGRYRRDVYCRHGDLHHQMPQLRWFGYGARSPTYLMPFTQRTIHHTANASSTTTPMSTMVRMPPITPISRAIQNVRI